jgi:hypothetical protein
VFRLNGNGETKPFQIGQSVNKERQIIKEAVNGGHELVTLRVEQGDLFSDRYRCSLFLGCGKRNRNGPERPVTQKIIKSSKKIYKKMEIYS